MEITIQMIKELRQATGAGPKNCKEVLQKTNGDVQAAIDLLREQGLAKAGKKSSREAKEGLIKLYAHPGNRVGVILEINCETDFVARNDQFVALAHDISLQIAAMSPRYVSKDDVPAADLERERDVLTAITLEEGKPENIVQKIVDGRMSKFYEEHCLLEQAFVKDDKKKIGQLVTEAIASLGENIVVRRFERYGLGE